jgi:hypothetical protein
MNRHDTHLLSSDEEEKEIEEDVNNFSFSDSNNSSYNSSDKYIIKQESNKNKFLYNKLLVPNNIDNVTKDKENVSIISRKDIEDIFYDIKSKDDINKTDKKNINKKKKTSTEKKLFVKLRKVKLNNENLNEIVEHCLTYNPANKKTKISFNNRSISSADSTKKTSKIKYNKSSAILSGNISKFDENEILFFFYKDNISGNQKLKKVINIINKQKVKFLKMSNNHFSIKETYRYKYPIISKNKENFVEREVVIRNKNNFIKNKANFNLPKQLFVNKYKKIINKNNNRPKSNYASTQRHLIEKLSAKPKNYNELYSFFREKTDNSKKVMKRAESSMKCKKFDIIKMNNKDYFRIKITNKNINACNKLLKVRALKYDVNSYHKHFGNNLNCPLCRKMNLKNEENVKKMLGIYQKIPDKKTNKIFVKKKRINSSQYRNSSNHRNNEKNCDLNPIKIEKELINDNTVLNEKENMEKLKNKYLGNEQNEEKIIIEKNNKSTGFHNIKIDKKICPQISFSTLTTQKNIFSKIN